MAKSTVRDDLMSPSFFKTFANPTGDQVLHLDATNGGAAPAGINHLPCMIFVRAEAGEILHIEDVVGAVSSHTFIAPFYGMIRCAPTILGDETTASVTVFWNPEP
jgi:hypothetical protein